MNKKLIVSILTLILGVTCMVIPRTTPEATIAIENISIAQDADYKTNVNFKFNHTNPDTAATEGLYTGFTSNINGKPRLVYALEEPTLTPSNIQKTTMPNNINKDTINAILALAENNTAETASKSAGLSSVDYLTTPQYAAATQLAIYKVVAQNSNSYYINDLGITPVGVDKVADWLFTKATAAATATKGQVEKDIIPDITLSIDKDKAFEDSTTLAGYKFYGPIRLVSNKTKKVSLVASDTNVKYFSAVGGQELVEIVTNSDFYIRFESERMYPKFNIEFTIDDQNFEVGVYGNNSFKVVTSAWVPSSMTTVLNMGDINSFGKIKISKFIDNSNSPISGAKFEVRDSSKALVATLLTDSTGTVISDNIPSGTYKIQEVNNNTGYNIDTKEFEATIKANGAIEPIVSYATLTSGTVDITVKDQVSGSAVGFSKFQIVRVADKSVMKEVTVDESGIISNLSLPLGDYYLKEIVTNPAYQLNTTDTQIKLNTEGTKLNLVVEKIPIKSTVKFTVLRTDNTPLTNVNLDVFKADGTWLSTIFTSANGTANLGLPNGTYYAKVKPYTGYAVNLNTQYPFTIYGNGETQLVDISLATAKGVVEFTVLSDTNTLVQNVEVAIFDSNNKHIETLVSDSNGKVYFSNLPEGENLTWKVNSVPYGFVLDSTISQFKLTNNGETVYRTVVVKTSKYVDNTTYNPTSSYTLPSNQNTPSTSSYYEYTNPSNSRTDRITTSTQTPSREITESQLINIGSDSAPISINSTAIDIGNNPAQSPVVITPQATSVTVVPSGVLTASANPRYLPATSDEVDNLTLARALLCVLSGCFIIFYFKERIDAN